MINVKQARHKMTGVRVSEIQLRVFPRQYVDEEEKEKSGAQPDVIDTEVHCALHRGEYTCGKLTVSTHMLSEKTLTALQQAIALIERDAAALLFDTNDANDYNNPTFGLPDKLS